MQKLTFNDDLGSFTRTISFLHEKYANFVFAAHGPFSMHDQCFGSCLHAREGPLIHVTESLDIN